MQTSCSEAPSSSESKEEQIEEKSRKRPISENSKESPLSKKQKQEKIEKEPLEELPMNVPFKVIDGVRHLSPYWAVYRTRTKGRWIGRKLVEAFTKEFVSFNPNYIKVACKLGRIYVNGKQMTNLDYVMKNGDRIEHWGHRHEHPVKDLPIEFIEDNDNLLVVNKPSSLPVHACGQYAIHTVLAQLRLRYKKTEKLRVLHRLDRTTSGILLLAKNYETDLDFKTTLKAGDWSKEYVCLVEGVFPEGDVVCEQPIGTLIVSMGIQCVRPDGKSAKSTFRRQACSLYLYSSRLWTNGENSACSVVIETGRTHQIRVHAQYLGYPIVNDTIYNSTIWGETKGKKADYGRGYEELGKAVQESHRKDLWLESIDPEYAIRMKKLAEEELTPEPVNLAVEDRPIYDSVCYNCHAIKKEVPKENYQMYLHCLKYETEKWSYKTPLPEWAEKPAK